MSVRRAQRLAALAITLAGGAGTALHLTGTLNLGEGSLWLPVTPLLGITALIHLRPRNTK